MKTFVNRRFAPRIYSQFPVPISIIYRGQKSAGEGIVQELSRVGCRILGSNDSMVVGKTLSVQLSLPTSERSLLIEQAIVQRVKGLEFGVAFEHLRQREAERLGHLLDALCGTGIYSRIEAKYKVLKSDATGNRDETTRYGEGIMESAKEVSVWNIRGCLLSSLDFAEDLSHNQPEHAAAVSSFTQDVRRIKKELMRSFEKGAAPSSLHDIMTALTGAKTLASIMAEHDPEKNELLTGFVESLKYAQEEFIQKVQPDKGQQA
jgi:hypothetical protein